MKIISLEIDSYKRFKTPIKINFNRDINLLIGINGSGKSTILEAIAIIFSSVKKYCEDSKTQEREFNFNVSYSFIKQNIVEDTTTTGNVIAEIFLVILTSSKESGMNYSMSVNGQILKTKREMLNYLPDNLVFYYAGFCETLKNIVQESETIQANKFRHIQNEKQQENIPDLLSKQIIYIKKKHFPLLFLLNYLGEKDFELPTSKEKYNFNSIVLHLKKPNDFKNNNAANFYGLSGFLRNYLDNLLNYARPLEIDDDTSSAQLIMDFDLGFISAISDFGKWADEYYDNNANYLLFHIFNLLLEIGILENFEINIVKELSIIRIEDLSEGEQQLITISAIKKSLLIDNSILVLDEPDAFLHPKKQRELIPHIKQIFTESHHQIILASHSPFVAQSIPLDFIRVFELSKKNPYTPEGSLLSYEAISDEIFKIKSDYSIEIESEIEKFKKIVKKFYTKEKPKIEEFKKSALALSERGEAMQYEVNFFVRQLIKDKKISEKKL